MKITNWFAADTYLHAGRNKNDRPLPGAETRLVRNTYDNSIAVRYHFTNIVTFCADHQSIILNTNGWNTLTTRRKMNQHLPGEVRVWSDKGVMKVGVKGETYIYNGPLTLTALADGSWEVKGAADEAFVKEQAKLSKAIIKYADGYTKALLAGKVEAPGAGDCWLCSRPSSVKFSHATIVDNQMVVEDGPASTTDHLLSHLEEKYYVPTLLWNAMDGVGASQYVRYMVAVLMHMPGSEGRELHTSELGYVQRDIPGIIRRYLRRELGLA